MSGPAKQFWNTLNNSYPTHKSWAEMFRSIQRLNESFGEAQFGFLADATAEILKGSPQIVDNLDLISFMQQLGIYVKRQSSHKLLKWILNKAERLTTIGDYYGRLTKIARGLQSSAFTGITSDSSSRWKRSLDDARKSDQETLNRYLTELFIEESLLPTIGFDEPKAVPTMASLRRYINDKRGDEQEIRFINAVISAVSHLSPSIVKDRVVDVKPWIITSFDADIGSLIGAGSLGKVFRGRWNGRDVAIKMLKNRHDISPRSAYVNREMETWSKLHHPNVLRFLGGNGLDNESFIVMPFLKHQTSRDYIQKHPDCNRLRLLYQTSLGLLYLHSENIIHGNIKGLNILVDDTEKPQLCDYGLGKLKADINSRSPVDPASSPFWGSQNWTAPELFLGDHPTFQCDIYSFGMTMYEIFADDIPLGYVPLGRLYNLVVERDVRPARPEASQLPDAAWALAEQCWATSPAHRVELPTLSEKLAALLPLSPGDGLPDRPPSIPPGALSSVGFSTNLSQPTSLKPEVTEGIAFW